MENDPRMWLGIDTPLSQIGISVGNLCHTFGHRGDFFLRNAHVSGNQFTDPALKQGLILCAQDLCCLMGLN